MTAGTDTRAEILQRIQSIASSILAIPGLEMGEDTTARDVPGWDSLTHVQIIIGVEQAFGIRMSASEVAQLENAGSLVDVVQHHQARAEAGG
jgi:acyl carrier protein